MEKTIVALIIATYAMTIYSHHYYIFALFVCILIVFKIIKSRKIYIPNLHPNQNELFNRIQAKNVDFKALQQFLSEFKGSVDFESKAGFTPVMLAIAKNREDILHLLLMHGADPNYITKRTRELPLNRAIIYKNMKEIQDLLKHGANPELKDGLGFNAIEVCMFRNDDNGKMLKIFVQIIFSFKTAFPYAKYQKNIKADTIKKYTKTYKERIMRAEILRWLNLIANNPRKEITGKLYQEINPMYIANVIKYIC